MFLFLLLRLLFKEKSIQNERDYVENKDEVISE